MMNNEMQKHIAIPEKMPKPSYWPMLTAISILIMSWGIITSWMLFAAGFTGSVITITLWIKETTNDGAS